MVYTDNSRKDENMLRKLLPTLDHVGEDGFHVSDRWLRTCHKRHPMMKPFARRLSEAMYMLVREDHAKVCEQLRADGMSDQAIKDVDHFYFRKRCRTVIPPPHILAPRLQKVYEEGAAMEDPTTNVPLFSLATPQAFQNNMRLVRAGKISGKAGACAVGKGAQEGHA